MERNHLLLFALLLICLTDGILFTVYIITMRAVYYRNHRSILRQSKLAFRRLLCFFCLLQIIFLSIGFANISSSIYDIYGTEVVSQYRLGFILSLGLYTFGEAGGLGLAIWSHLKYMPLRLVRMRYAWVAHGLFSGSAIFTVVVWYFNGVDMNNEIILSWCAIVLFEAGIGFWIFAILEGETTIGGFYPPRDNQWAVN
jgi:hypothetical protein